MLVELQVLDTVRDTLTTATATDPLPWIEVLGPILATLLPWLQGRLTVPILDAMKSAMAWLNRQPDWIKQSAVLGINAVFASVAMALGVELPGMGEWTSASVTTLLGALVAFTNHQTKKTRQLQDEMTTLRASTTVVG